MGAAIAGEGFEREHSFERVFLFLEAKEPTACSSLAIVSAVPSE
jgi:hypothetical protein